MRDRVERGQGAAVPRVITPSRRGPGSPARSAAAPVGVLQVDDRARSRAPPAAHAGPKPRQRSSRPALPRSWFTHSPSNTSARAIRPPASNPARYSGLADVGEDAEVAEAVAAGVDRDRPGCRRGRRAGSGPAAPARRAARPPARRAWPRSPRRSAGASAPCRRCRARGRRPRRWSGAPRRRGLLDDRPERVGRLAVADDRDPRRGDPQALAALGRGSRRRSRAASSPYDDVGLAHVRGAAAAGDREPSASRSRRPALTAVPVASRDARRQPRALAERAGRASARPRARRAGR